MYQMEKTVLRMTNPDRVMPGITSNKLDEPKNAFLDRFARIIVTFEQVRDSKDMLIVMHPFYEEQLRDHLAKFLKISGATLEHTEYKVYFVQNAHPGILIPYGPAFLLLSSDELEQNMTQEEFTRWRLENNMPLHGVDFTNEMILNVSYDYVSFQKGCYLGQETVVRVHHQSKPPKKLVVADADEVENPDDMTSVLEVNGKKKGFVFVSNH